MMSAHDGEKNIADCVQVFPSAKFVVDFLLFHFIFYLLLYWIFSHSCHFPEVFWFSFSPKC